MLFTRTLLGQALSAALLVGAVSGCNDDRVPNPQKSPDPKPPVPATAPVAQAQSPATRATAKVPAPPQPVDTFMSITLGDGAQPRMITFPPAKLRLKKSAEGMQAVLYTDDPPAAASKDYRGNSYLFEMDLTDLADAEAVDGAQFQYRAESSSGGAADRAVETTNGVFLNGWDTHLQPADVMIAFEGRPPQLMAKVVGTFRVVTSERDAQQPRLATVQAVLPAIVEASGK